MTIQVRVYRSDSVDEYKCESWSVKDGNYLFLCKNKIFNTNHCTDIINMVQCTNIEIDYGES